MQSKGKAKAKASEHSDAEATMDMNRDDSDSDTTGGERYTGYTTRSRVLHIEEPVCGHKKQKAKTKRYQKCTALSVNTHVAITIHC